MSSQTLPLQQKTIGVAMLAILLFMVTTIGSVLINASQVSAINNNNELSDPSFARVTRQTSSTISIGWVHDVVGASYVITGEPAFFAPTTSPSASSITLVGLTPNTKYSITIRAFKNGVYSEGLVLPSAFTLAATPLNFKATVIGSTFITATWDSNKNPDYTFYYFSPFDTPTSSVATTETSLTLKNLKSSTQYTLKVKAFNDFMPFNVAPNVNAFTDEVSINVKTKPFNDPTNFVVSDLGTSTLKLSWSANGSPSGTLYRVTVSSDMASSTTSDLFLNVYGLKPNKFYTFTVNSINDDGSNNNPVIATATTKIEPVADVTDPDSAELEAYTSTTLDISWEHDLTGLVYRVSTNTSSISVTTTLKKIKLVGLTPNTEYLIIIQAQKPGGSYTGGLAFTAFTGPALPINLKTTAITTSSITATWDANKNPDGTLYHLISPSSLFKTVTTTLKTAIITNLKPATTYTLIVKARHKIKSIVFADSAAIKVTTPAVQPTNVVATTISNNQINVEWNGGANATGTEYYVTAMKPVGNEVVASSSWITVTKYSFITLTCGKSYIFGVKARNSDQVETLTTTSSSKTTGSCPGPELKQPTGLKATQITTNSLVLQWMGNGNPTGTIYSIIRDSNLATTTTNLTLSVSGLQPFTTYTFKVGPVEQDGSVSSTKTALLAVITEVTDPDSLKVTEEATSSISVSWHHKLKGVTYLITGEPVAGGAKIISVTTTASSTKLTGLIPNTNYKIKIQSTKNDGTYTSGLVTTEPFTLATEPTNLKVIVIGKTYVTVGWGSNLNPTGTVYALFDGASSTNRVTTTALAATLGGLKPSTKYILKVRAYNLTSGGSNSIAVSVTTSQFNDPAKIIVTDLTTNSLILHWDGMGNPTGTLYQVTADHDVQTSTVSSTILAVGGLKPGTSYKFFVSTKNNDGSTTNGVSTTVVTKAAIVVPVTPPAESGGGGGGGGGGSSPVPLLTNAQVSFDANTINYSQNSVALNLSSDGNPTLMAISDRADFASGAWIPFSARFTWNFGGTVNGPLTVYAKFRNVSTESGVASQTITLNRPTGAVSGGTTSGGIVVPSTGAIAPLGGGQVLGVKISRLDELLALVKPGQKGPLVTELQTELKKAGFYAKKHKLTGVYDSFTKKAVNKYKQSLKNRLTSDDGKVKGKKIVTPKMDKSKKTTTKATIKSSTKKTMTSTTTKKGGKK